MKLFVYVFLWIFFLSCSSPPVMAQDTLSTSVAKESVYKLDAMILKAIAEKLKVKLFIRHAPFNRRLYLMKDGTIDFMAGLLKRPEREKYIHFVPPPIRSDQTLFFLFPRETPPALGHIMIFIL